MDVQGRWEPLMHSRWDTTDGSVYIFRPSNNGGWRIGGISRDNATALIEAGLQSSAVEVRTLTEAVQMAHAVTGCETSLRRIENRYRLIDHGIDGLKWHNIYVARDRQGKNKWYIWIEGYSSTDDTLVSYVNEFSDRSFMTRQAAIEAFYEWMNSYPVQPSETALGY